MKTLTDEQKQEIIRLYKLKIMNRNIAQILGLNKHSVANYIYKFYLVDNPRVKNTSDYLTRMDDVMKLYRKEVPYKKISEMTGVKHYQITEILKFYKERRRDPLKIKTLNEIRVKVAEGNRICEIAEELNLGYNKVQYWVVKLRKEGVH
jgi:DNA-binding CsgD family transcriptional regulator